MHEATHHPSNTTLSLSRSPANSFRHGCLVTQRLHGMARVRARVGRASIVSLGKKVDEFELKSTFYAFILFVIEGLNAL